MPRATRRRPEPQQEHFVDPPSDPDEVDTGDVAEEDFMDDVDVEEEDDDDEEVPLDTGPTSTHPPPPPPHLKEISSLASWTVSTSKPGCSVSALRSPSTALFWQSDGPQPHYLNIHFFKLVAIAAMRIYLDFELDESYTPTKIAFLAGTGYNDLQEFSVMEFEKPRGWIEVDFGGVGAEEGGMGESDEEDVDAEGGEDGRRVRMPLLRAMLVQVKICENHQNGKDTHLRGLQIFARDDSVRKDRKPIVGAHESLVVRGGKKKARFPEPDWAMVPELR